MNNLGSLNKKRRALVKKLEALREDIRPKSIEYGNLARTPKYDRAYSLSRFNSLEKDLERLREQEADLRFELEQVELEISLAALKSD